MSGQFDDEMEWVRPREPWPSEQGDGWLHDLKNERDCVRTKTEADEVTIRQLSSGRAGTTGASVLLTRGCSPNAAVREDRWLPTLLRAA